MLDSDVQSSGTRHLDSSSDSTPPNSPFLPDSCAKQKSGRAYSPATSSLWLINSVSSAPLLFAWAQSDLAERLSLISCPVLELDTAAARVSPGLGYSLILKFRKRIENQI